MESEWCFFSCPPLQQILKIDERQIRCYKYRDDWIGLIDKFDDTRSGVFEFCECSDASIINRHLAFLSADR